MRDNRPDPTQPDYNRFVQEVQAFCIATTLQHRIEKTYDDAGRLYTSVQVLWDNWREVACEWRAMTPECRRFIHPEIFDRIQFEVAGALAQ
jgi:hypothetical protein